MDSRQLEVFVEVAREGSFTRAAAALHLVQSAVSATIASLEADLGERLFERTTRRVIPTAAGRALLPHALETQAAIRAARDAVDGVSGGLSGSIRIGYMTNVTLFDIPGLLGRFSRTHPDVSLNLSPAATGTAGLAKALEEDELDIAFLSATADDYPDLEVEVLARSRLGLGVAIDHPLATRERITLAETASLRFVDFRPGFANRTLVDRVFRKHALRREVQFETSDTNDTAALVRNGLGVGFLAEYLVRDDPTIHFIEVEDARIDQLVSVATMRGRSLSAAALRLSELARARTPAPDDPARTPAPHHRAKAPAPDNPADQESHEPRDTETPTP